MNGRGGDEQWAEEIGQIVGPLLTPIAFECGRCMPMANLFSDLCPVALRAKSNGESIYRILFLDLCPAALRAKLNGLSIYRILFIEIALRGHARPHATIVKNAVSPQSNRPGMGELATSRGVKSSGKSADYFLRHLPLSAGDACQWPI